MQALLFDLRYGLRTLFRQPGFTLVAVCSLALGIGLNTTIFSVVNAVLLKKTPISEPERLVEIYSSPTAEMPYLTTSYPDYVDLRKSADVFEGLAAHAMVRGILYRDGKSELVAGEVVTANYFDVLGVHPKLGRSFLPQEDEVEGAEPVAVLSYSLWQSHFASDPAVAGKAIRISGIEYTIVGVAPETFTGSIPGFKPDFWAPTAMVEKLRFSGIQADTPSPTGNTRRERRGTRWLFVKGRLASGRTVEEARAQVATIFVRLEKDNPVTNEKVKGAVLPASGVRFHPLIDGMLNQAGAVLLIAVGLVLLIACANVANMLLARAQNRTREIAVRLSVGASRAQLVRQLMTEALVLAGLGALAGIGLAAVAARLLTLFSLRFRSRSRSPTTWTDPSSATRSRSRSLLPFYSVSSRRCGPRGRDLVSALKASTAGSEGGTKRS